jgi:hypothetical protein
MQFPHIKWRIKMTSVCLSVENDENLTLFRFSSKISRFPALESVSGERMSLEVMMFVFDDGRGEADGLYILVPKSVVVKCT